MEEEVLGQDGLGECLVVPSSSLPPASRLSPSFADSLHLPLSRTNLPPLSPSPARLYNRHVPHPFHPLATLPPISTRAHHQRELVVGSTLSDRHLPSDRPRHRSNDDATDARVGDRARRLEQVVLRYQVHRESSAVRGRGGRSGWERSGRDVCGDEVSLSSSLGIDERSEGVGDRS